MKPCTLPLVITLTLVQIEAAGYAVVTHEEISRRAVHVSDLGKGTDVLRRLGMQPLPLTSTAQTFTTTQGIALPIADLIVFGAAWEDERSAFQAFRHFYNPANGSALDIPYLGTNISVPSPDWALEDVNGYFLDVPPQSFSYHDARTYLYAALTDRMAVQRELFFGKTFQTLGHVIHHLQDMAQPQHVRNDPHCDGSVCWVAGQLIDEFYHPSRYETWARDFPPAQAVFSGYAPVFSADETTKFTTPRAFWTTTNPTGQTADGVDGNGIAEFTHRGFFSQGTLSAAPPQMHDQPQLVDMVTLCADAESHGRPPCPPGLTNTDYMIFYGTTVADTLRPWMTSENARATSSSLFDEDLKDAGLPPTLVLNRFNFDAAYSFLLPRAVAYSAGLINYFFRGRLEISLPDEGVYAMVDHALPLGNDPVRGGFPRIKLRLQNKTPGGERMPDGGISAGRMVAVAKFHRNRCYQSDLSGEYGSPGVDWHGCRFSDEEIVVSDPIPVPYGINEGPVSVTFAFTAEPIPISATDIFLQVIYRGPLGEEREAVVVETRDISEPTYLYQHTLWDQIHFCSAWPLVSVTENVCTGPPNFADAWCAGGYPQSTNSDGSLNNDACNQAMGLTVKIQYSKDLGPISGYDPSYGGHPLPGKLYPLSQEPPFTPIATLMAPVGTLPRVAALFDVPQEGEEPPSAPNTGVYVQEVKDSTHDEYHFEWLVASARPTINQINTHTTPPTLISSIRYGGARGVYVNSLDLSLLTPPPGATYTFPPLVLGPSIFSGAAGAWYWPN